MQQTRRDTLPIDAAIELRRELVAHLRDNRTALREEWVRRITEAQLSAQDVDADEGYEHRGGIFDF